MTIHTTALREGSHGLHLRTPITDVVRVQGSSTRLDQTSVDVRLPVHPNLIGVDPSKDEFHVPTREGEQGNGLERVGVRAQLLAAYNETRRASIPSPRGSSCKGLFRPAAVPQDESPTQCQSIVPSLTGAVRTNIRGEMGGGGYI